MFSPDDMVVQSVAFLPHRFSLGSLVSSTSQNMPVGSLAMSFKNNKIKIDIQYRCNLLALHLIWCFLQPLNEFSYCVHKWGIRNRHKCRFSVDLNESRAAKAEYRLHFKWHTV